jgi:hypothetical protein
MVKCNSNNKMRLLIGFCLSLLMVSAFAQMSNDKDIPDVVQKNFNKKFPLAENVSWDKVENNYKADCFFHGRGTYAEYTPEGEWVQTVTDIDTKALYPPIAKYLNENFSKDKIVLAEQSIRADKKNYYYVQVARKEKDRKEPYIFELFFDKTGNIDQVKTPEGVPQMTVVGIDDPNNQTPAVVIDAWQKRFPHSEKIVWTKNKISVDSTVYHAAFIFKDYATRADFQQNGAWIETRVELDEKSLSEAILKYIKENHYDDDLVEAEKISAQGKQDLYYLKLERFQKGQTKPYVFELFFDKTGKLTKANRSEELKNQFLLTVDVPTEVAKKFNGRFSTARDVKWETKEGNWVSYFTYRDLPTSAEFTDSAAWVVTIVQLDPKSSLYAPIQRYISNEYSDYNVMYVEKATRADRNDYYYIELISKKKKAENQKVGLYFDKTGKLKETK